MSDSGPAYQARIPIYPRSVKGRYRAIKWGVLTLAYGVYFLLPWLRWERAGGAGQAVLFDIEGRRFYIFDLVIHPQDIFWLAAFLMIAAFLLFFVTAVAGRVFCGYFCFQTLWTDIYILIERLVQGERPARIRLDKAPWGAGKVVKKGLTHLLWLLVAFATGLTFTLYWADAPLLIRQFFTGEAPFPAYATTAFLTATTYVMAGLAREQVCTYMCPYARFQSAMFDQDTLIVSYDESRGEGSRGRARLRKGLKSREERQAQGVGDCIDCGYCVQVCPTGIDIRNGLQLQCVSCALCIDACNTIMDSLGWERGLVRYDSKRRLETGERTRVLRLKNIGYALVLTVAIGALIWNIATQADLDMAAYQIRQPLYVVLSDGRILNRYDIKINNKAERPARFRLEIDGLPDAELDLGATEVLTVPADHSLSVRAKVRVEPRGREGQLPFAFVLRDIDDGERPPVRQEVDFSLPVSGRRSGE
ncbi:MAG TPA: cytochrome c oxidase accessory protein CcoG [Thiotrichales bacterium]|nr:cytochrome c oxidase accessory protein CcoG [Thiotrichales bacterium]